MPESRIAALTQMGWELVTHIRADAIRLMCSWSTSAAEIERFVRDVERTIPET